MEKVAGAQRHSPRIVCLVLAKIIQSSQQINLFPGGNSGADLKKRRQPRMCNVSSSLGSIVVEAGAKYD
jgi:hypothetical protein